MEAIINGIQQQIKVIDGIKHIDEDWGQLDYYSPNFPVKFPCVLIDVSETHFKDLGTDYTAKPANRQTAEMNVTITIANVRLTNSSGMAPVFQKNNARSIHKLIEDIHVKLHGKKAYEKTGVLLRKSLRRIKRDDGVQEYEIIYKLRIKDV